MRRRLTAGISLLLLYATFIPVYGLLSVILLRIAWEDEIPFEEYRARGMLAVGAVAGGALATMTWRRLTRRGFASTEASNTVGVLTGAISVLLLYATFTLGYGVIFAAAVDITYYESERWPVHDVAQRLATAGLMFGLGSMVGGGLAKMIRRTLTPKGTNGGTGGDRSHAGKVMGSKRR